MGRRAVRLPEEIGVKCPETGEPGWSVVSTCVCAVVLRERGVGISGGGVPSAGTAGSVPLLNGSFRSLPGKVRGVVLAILSK